MISPADYALRVTHAAEPRRKAVGLSSATAPRHKKLSDLMSKLSKNPTILGHSLHPALSPKARVLGAYDAGGPVQLGTRLDEGGENV